MRIDSITLPHGPRFSAHGFDDVAEEDVIAFLSEPCGFAWGEGTLSKRWFNYDHTDRKKSPWPWIGAIPPRNENAISRLDIIERLTHFQPGSKDGTAILQGSVASSPGARKSVSMVANAVMLIDIDCGFDLDGIQRLLEERGLFGVISTTHSHMKGATSVAESALCGADGGPPSLAEAAAYLRDTKGYLPEIVASVTGISKVHEAEGAKWRIEHGPLPRARLVLFLSAPYLFVVDAETQNDRIKRWANLYHAVCRDLGIPYDRTCHDPSRLMYLPRHAVGKGDDHEMRIVWGAALDLSGYAEFTGLLANSRTKSTKATAGKASAATTMPLNVEKSEVKTTTVTKRKAKFTTPWLAKFLAHPAAKTLRLASLYADRAARGLCELRRDGDVPPKVHIDCPEEDTHSTKDTSPFFVTDTTEDSDTAGGRQWTARCAHEGCQRRATPEGRDKPDRAYWLDLLIQRDDISPEEIAEFCDPNQRADLSAKIGGVTGIVQRRADLTAFAEGVEFLRDQRLDDDGFEISGQLNTRTPNAFNFELCLQRLGVSLVYDEFRRTVFVRGLDGYGPELSDSALVSLRIRIEHQYGIKFLKESAFELAVHAAERNSIHPIREKLARLESTWDGVQRIDRLFVDYFGADDTPLVRAMAACTMIAAVRRIREPGTKHDNMVVLEGTQGLGKSSAVAALAGGPEFFTDSLPIGASPQEVLMCTAGIWFVEISELAGMGYKDVGAIKAFLSRNTDKARPPYGRAVVSVPRQFIVWGTTNDERYLRDRTGARRFWPVACRKIDVPAIIRDCSQLWAEAATRETAEESHGLPESLWKDAAKVQDERHEESDIEITLEAAFAGIAGGRVRYSDVARMCGAIHQSQKNQMTDAMAKFGWTKTRLRMGKDESVTTVYTKGEGEISTRVLTLSRDQNTGLFRFTVSYPGSLAGC